jgi:hypothetical protein
VERDPLLVEQHLAGGGGRAFILYFRAGCSTLHYKVKFTGLTQNSQVDPAV